MKREATSIMTSNGSSPSASNGSPPSKADLSVSNGNNNDDSSGKGKEATAMSSFKLILLITMVLQNSSTVLVGRHTRSTSESVTVDDLYVVNNFLVVTETSKLLLAAALEFWTTKGKLYQSLQTHCFSNPLDACKIMVPALLYLVQNTLLYVALGNLTAPIFQVTYQAKLVTTALVSVVMLQRSYSIQQWLCLFGLSMGVATVVLGEKAASGKVDDEEKKGDGNLVVGLMAVSISCLSSALAGVYFEKVLKKKNTPNTTKTVDGSPAPAATPQPSLWMRNIQLAFFSVLIALGNGWWKDFQDAKLGEKSEEKPYLFGFTPYVWILVALQAGGGMLVAAVIKYADNVLKGLATGVSVVLSSALSMLIFRTPLGTLFVVGATVILTSVYYFSNTAPPAVQALCARTCGVQLNSVWGYKEKSSSSSSSSSSTVSTSSDDASQASSTAEMTKNLLPK